MNDMTIIATTVGLIAALIIGRLVLQSGVLINNCNKFVTHNLRYSKLPNDQLRLKGTGGLLTDRFDITLNIAEIDRIAFTSGHRPMNKSLDKQGYKVYRVVHIQKKSGAEVRRTIIGDFTLKPSAQNKFEQFTQQLMKSQQPGGETSSA